MTIQLALAASPENALSRAMADVLFRFQTFLEQLGRQFIQACTAFLRQRMQLFDQVAVELDREGDQSKGLVAFTLLAPIQDGGCALAESAGGPGLAQLAVDFLAFVFFECGFFQNEKFECSLKGSGLLPWHAMRERISRAQGQPPI
jgi:hypothetical protein